MHKVDVPWPLLGRGSLWLDSCKRPLSLCILGGRLRRFNCILIRFICFRLLSSSILSLLFQGMNRGETLLCTSWPNWNTQVSILFMVVNFIVQYKMYYVRFTVSNPFVCLRYLQLIQITNNMLFWFTMSRKEKPNPILFLFVIKIIITPCLVNNKHYHHTWRWLSVWRLNLSKSTLSVYMLKKGQISKRIDIDVFFDSFCFYSPGHTQATTCCQFFIICWGWPNLED